MPCGWNAARSTDCISQLCRSAPRWNRRSSFASGCSPGSPPLERPQPACRKAADPLRHRLEYLLVSAVVFLVRITPDPIVRAAGRALGRTAYLVDRRRRRIAEQNLAAAFPSRSPDERRAIVRGAFAHFGVLLLELLKFSTLSPDEMLARVEF